MSAGEEEREESAALIDTRCTVCQSEQNTAAHVSCGLWLCPACASSDPDQEGSEGTRCSVRDVSDRLKLVLRRAFEAEAGNEVYTGAFISFSDQLFLEQHPIKLLDMMKQNVEGVHTVYPPRPLRLVLTIGEAGVGKTFSVRRFCLDWAQGSENQDLDLVVPLSFRELNLVRRERYSLMELIQAFYPALKISPQALSRSKVLFICDGLDESRLPLDVSCEVISEVTQRSEVSELLVNLFRGDLLPQALIWITSRPAASDQILRMHVNRFSEIQGFIFDFFGLKEQFFRERFTNEEKFNNAMSLLRTSRSLYNMCQVPLVCWITATVLDHVLTTCQSGPLPQTLTELYAHFLLAKILRTKTTKKSDLMASCQQLSISGPELTTADCELLLKLGRLAFDHLHTGNIMFYQEDLEQVGLDLSEASVDSGLCSEVFKRDSVFNKPVYSFIHLSLQEFLAAVYFHHCFNNNKTEVLNVLLETKISEEPVMGLDEVLKETLKKCPSDQDLFVRFLHGLSVESTHRVLGPLLGPNKANEATIQKVTDHLKTVSKRHTCPTKALRSLLCLSEMKVCPEQQTILDLLKSEKKSELLTPSQCSILASLLQLQEDVLEEMDVMNFHTDFEGLARMAPATSNCRKTRLTSLSGHHCLILASVLMTQNNPLRHLDLGFNRTLWDSGVYALCQGLQSPHCKLETLSLTHCGLSDRDISILAEALMSNPFHLRDLNLHNCCGDQGVSALVPFLQSPHCRLHTLRLGGWYLTAVGCSALTTALMSNPSHLRVLRFDNSSQLGDSGVIALTPFLLSPECRLRTLSLHHCGLTSEEGGSALASALEVCSSLKELDLSINYLQESAVRALSRGLTSPRCRLDLLRMTACHLSEDTGFSALASALQSNPSSLRELGLVSNYNLSDPGVTALSGFLQSPDCSLHTLSLRGCKMSGVGCSALASALTSNPCHLRSLDLEDNLLGDSGVNALSRYLQSPQCELQTLSLNSCGVSSVGVSVLVSALMSNPRHLRVLDLGQNRDLGDSGLQSVSQYLQSPDCGLQELRLSGCGLSEESACSALASALEACSSLKTLDLSNNHLQESAVTALSHGLRNPDCRLETLSLNSCQLSVDSCSSLASALRSNPDSVLTKLDLGNNSLPHRVPDLTEVLQDPDSRLQKLITFTRVLCCCETFIPPKEKSQQEKEESQDLEELPSEQDQDHPDVTES